MRGKLGTVDKFQAWELCGLLLDWAWRKRSGGNQGQFPVFDLRNWVSHLLRLAIRGVEGWVKE